MNKKILYALTASLMLLGAACSSDDNKQDEPTPPAPEGPAKPNVKIYLTSTQRATSKQAITVGEEMFQALCADAANAGKVVAFSPMGANSMLCAAAQLDFGNAYTDVNAFYGNYRQVQSLYDVLQTRLAELDSDVKLSSATSLTCNQAFYDSNNVAASLNEGDALAVDITSTDKPVLASTAAVEAPFGEVTAEFGSGLLFKYSDDAKVRVGKNCYSVSLPLGTTGAYELVVAKAEPGVDINTVIASGEIFDPGNARYNNKPFTIAIPSSLSVDDDLSMGSAIKALQAKYVTEGTPSIESAVSFSAGGKLSLTQGNASASGSSSATISRAWDGGYASGFINVADGNCVVSVIEASTKTCLFMAKLP